MMHTYKAIQGQAGVFTLLKDGFMAICPKTAFAMPMQVEQPSALAIGQPAQQQMQIQERRNPCNTTCPFACINKKEKFKEAEGGGRTPDGEQYYYDITCEGASMSLQLDEIVMFKKEPADKTTLRPA